MSPGHRKLVAALAIVGVTTFMGRYWWVEGVTSGDPVAQAKAALFVWGAWTGGGAFTLDVAIFRRCNRVGFALLLPATMYGMYDATRILDVAANLGLLLLAGTLTVIDVLTRRHAQPSGAR